jgi:hypothetical protein
MIPAQQDIVVNRGARLDAQAAVSVDYPLEAACLIVLDADGAVLLTANAAPQVTVDVPTNSVAIAIAGSAVQAFVDAGAARYQLDVRTTDGGEFRILKGRIVKGSGVAPVFA